MIRQLAAATIIVGALTGAALAQSADAGAKVFKKCKACHRIGAGAKNRTGPVLTGVIGRQAGTYDGYKYSKYMIAAGEAGLVWSEDLIFDYVVDPTKFLRAFLDDPKAKAKMKFKLKPEDDRRDVAAYLATFSTAAAEPLPTPDHGFCIVNASHEPFFFAAETREGDRQAQNLQPGDQLCSVATAALDGVVSVYESEDGFEGCSRIIPVGTSEQMFEFAQFDRCGWSSHKS